MPVILKVGIPKALLELFFLTYFFVRVCLISRNPINFDTFLLDSPTWGVAFRETQTLWGIRDATRNGLSLFDLEVPVLGPPFKVPFEMPLFQNLVAIICGTLDSDIVITARIVSLLFFVLNTYLVAKFFRHRFGLARSLFFSGITLLTPFSLVWSSTALIESFTLTLLIVSLYWFYLYVNFPKNYLLLISLFFLSLTSLSKITTAFPIGPLLFFLVWRSNQCLKTSFEAKSFCSQGGRKFSLIAFLSLTLSVLPGALWTVYADSVKEKSIFTSWLTSYNLRTWNFGEISQRLEVLTWLAIGGRLYLLCGLSLVALVLLCIKPTKFPLPLALFATSLSPILLYTNLYFHHDYYFLANQLMITWAISEVLTSDSVIKRLNENNKSNLLVMSILIATLSTSWLWTPGHDYKRHIFTNASNSLDYIDFVRDNTERGDWILTYGCDWNPALHFYADRKGLAIPDSMPDLKMTFKLIEGEFEISRFRFLIDCRRKLGSPIPELIGAKVSVRSTLDSRVYKIVEKQES